MASGFSHRSPLWPDGFGQLGSLFQAMTSKPPIWQAPSQDAWLSVYRHPDPHTPFPVRITGCSNRNRSLPEFYPGFLRFPWKCIMPVPSHMGKAAAADDILQFIVTAEAIAGKVPGESFQEFFRMISAPAGLVIIQTDRRQPIISGAIQPHIGLGLCRFPLPPSVPGRVFHLHG